MSVRMDNLVHALVGERTRARRDAKQSVFESATSGLPVGEHGTRYSASATLGPSEVEGLLAHDWRARREITQPMGDLTRLGVKIEGLPSWVDEDAVQSALEGDELDGTTGILSALAEHWAEGEAYGGAVLIAIADDGRPSFEPLDRTRLRAVTSWQVLDRWSVWPYREGGFGAPISYWTIVDTSGALDRATQIVHPSRLVVHTGIWMPGRWRRLRDGWGLSRLEVLRDQRDTLASGHAQLSRLLGRSSQDVVYLAELAEMTEEYGEDFVYASLRRMNASLSSTGLLALDAGLDAGDGGASAANPGRVSDNFTTMARPLGGARDIAEMQHEDWRRGSGQPRLIADGEVLGGLNSGEGAGEWRSWGGQIAAIQTKDLTPRLNWALGLLFAAKEGPTSGRIPESWKVCWNPIAEDDPKAEAEVSEINARTDSVYYSIGALRETEIRKHRAVDGLGGPVRVESADLLPEPTEAEIEAETLEQDPGAALAAGAGEPTDVQQQALNGAQIQSLAELAGAVGRGEMAPEVATWLVELAVPGLGTEGARAVMSVAARWGAEKLASAPPAPPPAGLAVADGFASAFGFHVSRADRLPQRSYGERLAFWGRG